MLVKTQRRQQTIGRSVQVSGFGLFGGLDVTIEFCPAPTDHGVVFERVDLARPVKIPALIENVIPRPRCTVISKENVEVCVIEHVMAALAGLQVDNCLVRINAPEPPACDGSSREFVSQLLKAGIVQQDRDRLAIEVDEPLLVTESETVGIAAQPPCDEEYVIGFFLDYGDQAIPQQSLRTIVTQSEFVERIAPCRTFVLEKEVQALQANGIGCRATPQNVLVFNESGPIENTLQFPDECVRHKILDCIGDFALLGYDIFGRFTATQSGHRLNHAIIRSIYDRLSEKLQRTHKITKSTSIRPQLLRTAS